MYAAKYRKEMLFFRY